MKFSKKPNYKITFVISLLFHLAFLIALMNDWITQNNSNKEIDNKNIEITVIDQNKIDKNLQIVEQDQKTVNEETPKDAKFLSAKNQVVKKETKAKSSGQFSNENGQTQDLEKNNQKDQNKNIVKKENGIEKFKPLFNWDQITPSNSALGMKSQTSDYLKGVKESNETLLNTREFIYYTYYNRIKKQLQQFWEPSIRGKVTKLFKEGRKIASDTEKTTKVIIVLNEKGILVRIQVIEQSGVRDLDDAAVEAFKAAAPFPNPPKGIVESDGMIRIRWDFILES